MSSRLLHKRVVLPLVAAGSVVLVVWLLVRFTPIVPDQVARSFTANLLRERGYRLEIGRVRGNLLGDVVLNDVSLVPERGGGEPAATVRELQLRVHPWRLFRGRVEIGWLRLVEPRLRVGPQGLQADLLRPRGGVARAVTPPVHIGRLEIANGQVEARGETGAALRVEHAYVRLALDAAAGRVRIELQRGSARIPGRGVELRSAAGVCIVQGDSVQLQDLQLETARSHLTLAGTLHRGPAAAHAASARWLRRASLVGTAAPFELADLDSIVVLPVQGRIDGPIQLGLQDSSIAFAGTWTGSIREGALDVSLPSYPLQDVQADLVWAPGHLEVRRARGALAGNAFDLACGVRGEFVHGSVGFTDLDLRTLRADLPPSALTGRVRFARPSARDTLRLDAELGESRLEAWGFGGLDARVGVLGGRVWVRSAELDAPGIAVHVVGEASPQDVALDWELDAADASALFRNLGIAAGGAVRAQGSIVGPLAGPACSAAGEFSNLAFGNVGAGTGDFTLDVEALRREPRVELDVRGSDLRAGGRSFESFSSLLTFADGTLDLQRTQASSGDTLLAFAGNLQRVGRDWQGEPRRSLLLRLDTALVQVGSEEIRVEDPASVWWSGRATRVDSLRLVSRGASLRVDGSVDLARSRIDSRCEIDDFDLALLARLVRLRVDVGGTGTGWVELHGSLERTQVDARLRVDSGHWNTLPIDSLRVDVQSDAFGTALRSLRLQTPHGAATVEGRLAYLPALRRWVAGEPGTRAPDELSRALVEGTVRLDGVELERVWGALRRGGPAPDWAARVTARLGLEGTVASPRLGAVGVVHGVRAARTVQVDSLSFTARYADGDLEVQRFEAGAAGALLQAAGHVPVDLHLARGARLRRADAVAARVRLPQGSSFAIVTHFIPLFVPPPPGSTLGTIAANLDVNGTAGAPKLRGDLRVDKASFMLADMEEVYRDVHVAGVFEGETLRLSELRGRSGSDGRLQGRGQVVLRGLRVADYQLAVDVGKVWVYTVPEMTALVSGHLDVRAADVGRRQPVPEIRGTLQILEATITKDFESDAETADLLESTDRPEWLADISLDAPGSVWVRNSNAEVELSGKIEVVRTTAGMDVKGAAVVQRGYYGVYLERFEITRGELDFSRYSGFEPDLDVEGRRGRAGQRIYVHLTGRPSEPHLAFSSDQGGSTEELQQELLTAIGNDPTSALSSAASAAATQIVANVAYVDDYVHSISIDPAASTEGEKTNQALFEAYNVSAGLALTDRVFMTYTYGFNRSDLNQRVSLELDVLRGVLLSSAWESRSVPSRQEHTDSAQSAFQVDLKFRYER